MTNEQTLKLLDRLVGTWTTEATHPLLPGIVVHGTVIVEWLEGERFLIHRARTDHPDFPDAIAIVGFTQHDRVDRASSVAADDAPSHLSMHYFDSRGVFRLCDASIEAEAWKWSHEAPGFSQRFTGTFTDGDDTMVGVSQLCQDDVHWQDDLAITYRRRR